MKILSGHGIQNQIAGDFVEFLVVHYNDILSWTY